MQFFSLKVFPFLITASGWYYHFDVLNFIHLISSTGLAIVAEVDLRCGDFLFEKSCHKLVVSTSFLSRLLNVSSVLTSLKTQQKFFGLLMRFGFADSLWQY